VWSSTPMDALDRTPPLPLLAPRGGYDGPGECGEQLTYLPSELRRRTWQWPLLTMLRQTLQTEAIPQLVDACCRQYPHGLVPTVQKGHVPSQAQSAARAVARSVGSPPSSGRRLARDDGEWGTSPYRSHRTDRVAQATGDVLTCMGRMVPHPMPNGCKRMWYDGGQATKPFAKGKGIRHAAWAKVEGVIQGAVQIMARLTSRQRDAQSTGRDL